MSTTPNTRSDTEKWMEQLGTGFVNVRLYVQSDLPGRPPCWIEERHVDDPETLFTTICMSLERLKGRFAVWPDGDGYLLVDARERTQKHYGSREAAEMAAILRAR